MSRGYDNVTFAVERITPATASKYLQKNSQNRRLSRLTVSRYADAILRGEWVVNGEAIKFDGQGNLLDGQHRLFACVEANRPIDACVIRGLSTEAFTTIDKGKGRSHADNLYVLDYKNPHALAAAARLVYRYEQSNWSAWYKRHVSTEQLLAVIDRHPRLVTSSEDYMRAPLFTRLVPHSVGIFSYYLQAELAEKKAAQFWTEIAADDYASEADDYPPRKLHDRLYQVSLEYIKPNSTIKLAWVIMAWNAFYAEQPAPPLSRMIEDLPRFVPRPFKA